MTRSNKALLTSAAFAAPVDNGAAEPKLSKADRSLVKGIRKVFEEEQGHDMRITDDAILAIVNKLGDDWDGMEQEEQMALFVKAEDAFKGIAISNPGISGLVSKMDPDFTKEIEACLEAFVKSKQSTVDIYGQLKRIWTKDQFDACPYPGTTADDVKGTNYSPDIVETKTPAGVKVRTVFIDDLVQAMPLGKKFQKDIDDAIAEGKVSDSVARFKGLGKQEIADIKNNATQGRTNLRKLLRTAIQLHHKLSAIEGMPKVKLTWIKGTNDLCPKVPKNYGGKETFKVTRHNKCFWLVPVIDGEPDHAKGKDYSYSQIIAFDPHWALQQPDGGTIADLKESAKTEPETPETQGEKMSEEAMDNAIVVLHAKLSNTVARAAVRKRIIEPDNDELRASYCALYLDLENIYKANQKWYDNYLHGEETKEQQEERKAG